MRGLLLVFFVGCHGAPAAHPNAATMWIQLKSTLTGTWNAPTASGVVIHESFRLVSNESALVESFTTASGKETISVYHPDNGDLVLTHYCAQGNQPRLRASAFSDHGITFRFADATNVSPQQSVLVEKRIELAGDALEQTEIYRAPDGTLETTVYHFVR